MRCWRGAVLAVLFWGAWGGGSSAEGERERERPNVIVIYSDDHGWADLGANGVRQDIRTPNLDRLAADGALCTRGYVTAPQCVPSRAGVMTGRHQNNFGVEDNLKGPLPHSERTLADMMGSAGYVTGMVGKWHLDVRQTAGAVAGDGAGAVEKERAKAKGKGARKQQAGPRAESLLDHLPNRHGFAEMFCGTMGSYWATHDLKGQALANAPVRVEDGRFRVEVQTEAALSFIQRNAEKPFFLYLAYFAPHVPLGATEEYLARFPGEMPRERRLALAMLSAVDDGVGAIRKLLAERGLSERTIIFFIGDNGAPLKTNAWNGSLNEPLVGEKGMLTDGGIRVPFVAAWPGVWPSGLKYGEAVSSLDVVASALAGAGIAAQGAWRLEGVDLGPYFKGERSGRPHEELYWRWRSQAAILAGDWKYVRLGPDQEYLFDVASPAGETKNLIEEHKDKGEMLREKLKAWSDGLPNAGLPLETNAQDQLFYEGIPARAWRTRE